MPTHTTSARPRSTDWAIRYTQTDVDVIRAQIIQSEALKRRWLVLALILAIAGLATVLVLLSTSYALYAGASNAKESLEQENSAIAIRAAEAEKGLEERRARDAEQHKAQGEAQERLKGLLAMVTGNSDVPTSVGARFARTVHELGGRVETESKPSDKLFRNWRVTTSSGAEIYTLVGGFDDGKWVIYSNLIARRAATPAAGKEGQDTDRLAQARAGSPADRSSTAKP